MKSVWLKKYIITSLAQRDNIISSEHDCLLSLLGVQEDMLVFLEPDGTVSFIVKCSGRDVVELPEDRVHITQELQNMNANDTAWKTTGAGMLIPLKTENTSVFGAVILPEKHETVTETDDLKNALLSFSILLYNEGMGSIVQSYNPVLFKIRNLDVIYGNNVKAVDNVSFDICEKEFTVILGTSGCGKTTIVNVIGGMLHPTAGKVWWKDRDISQMSRSERSLYRREKIGFIFQQYNLISSLTGRANIEIAASLVDDPVSVDEVLKMVGMENKADRYPSQMSGGEQQRISIARALAKGSRVLICDEPTGALDPENSKRIAILLTKLVKEQGVSVIMITHNPAFSVLADRLIMMSSGTIMEDIRQPFPLPAEILNLR